MNILKEIKGDGFVIFMKPYYWLGQFREQKWVLPFWHFSHLSGESIGSDIHLFLNVLPKHRKNEKCCHFVNDLQPLHPNG